MGLYGKSQYTSAEKRKLGPKTLDCVFLGYAQNSTTYRFLVVKSYSPDVSIYTIMESRDASFFEKVYPMRSASNSETQIYNNLKQLLHQNQIVNHFHPMKIMIKSMMLHTEVRDKGL